MLKLTIAVAAILAGFALVDAGRSPADAAGCSEGSRNGKCINVGLARAMRLEGRALAQSRLSKTAAPVPLAVSGAGGPTPAFDSTTGVFRSAPCRQTPLGPQC